MTLKTKNEGRMMCYSFQNEFGTFNQTKFGEHWVKASLNTSLTNAIDATIKNRIRNGHFSGKQLEFDNGVADGSIQVKVWDVSDYAKKFNKFKEKSHIDDVIRGHIGIADVEVGREYHNMSFDELSILVNKELSRIGQKLPEVKLSTYQFNVADDLLNHFESGDKVIVLEGCPRLGKTILAGAIFDTMQADVTIIASYVKTVFTSFASDFLEFEQFAKFVHVDMNDKDSEDQVNAALAENKKVIAYLSTNQGTKRQGRIDFLFTLNVSKLLIVDEADFGSKKVNQAGPLSKASKENDVPVLLMTGTKADEASLYWDVDYKKSVTYAELLIQRIESENELLFQKT